MRLVSVTDRKSAGARSGERKSMPRTTNADLILSEARDRLAVAVQAERDAAAELRLAAAVVDVHRANLAAAEKLLAPKPRKKAEPKPQPPPPQKPEQVMSAQKDPRCAACYEIEDHANHDLRYSSAHKFDPPTSGKKAKQKPAAATPDLEKETAIAAGAD